MLGQWCISNYSRYQSRSDKLTLALSWANIVLTTLISQNMPTLAQCFPDNSGIRVWTWHIDIGPMLDQRCLANANHLPTVQPLANVGPSYSCYLGRPNTVLLGEAQNYQFGSPELSSFFHILPKIREVSYYFPHLWSVHQISTDRGSVREPHWTLPFGI